MLIKFKEFIQKYWISILISWFFIWLWMAYYGDNTIVKLVVYPIISFFLVILFHLELERKNIKYLSIIQMLIGMASIPISTPPDSYESLARIRD